MTLSFFRGNLTDFASQSPRDQIEDQMVPAKFRRIVSKAAPKRPKRYVMDCVLLPVYRPPKRKERPVEHVSSTEQGGPRPRDEVCVSLPSLLLH